MQKKCLFPKDNTSITKSISIEKESVPLFRLQHNSVMIQGDIISSIEEDWDATNTSLLNTADRTIKKSIFQSNTKNDLSAV